MKKNIRLCALIFFLALAVRVFYLEQIRGDFLFHHPIVDSGAYDQSSAKASQARSADEGLRGLRRIPLYRSFLTRIYKTVGHNVYFTRFAQSIIGSLSCVLIFLLGHSVFNDRVGAISGIIAAIYWPFVAFGAKFLPVNLAIIFSILTVLSLVRFQKKNNILWLALAGICLALSAMSRANILLLFPVFALWLLVRSAGKIKIPTRLLSVFVLSLCFILVLSPVLLKFYSVRKEVMPVQDNYGVGVYFGSDLEMVRTRPGSSWRRLMMELLDKDLTQINERNLYFLSKTMELITTRPLYFATNFFKKIYILLNYYEFSPRENINYFRGKSKFLSLPFLNFGSIAAFSILGMVFARKKSEFTAGPLYLFALAYFVSVLPFMPLARYRLPIVPFVIVFASFCIVHVIELYGRMSRQEKAAFISLFLPLFILTNTNVFHEYLNSFSRPYYHEGLAYYKHSHDSALALEYLRKSLFMRPDDPDVYETMGNIYLYNDELKKAEVSYRRALMLERRFPEVMNNLGIVYAKRGELERAKSIFREVLFLSPVESVKARINLGGIYFMEKNYRQAETEYKRALFLDPDNLQALYRLALVYDQTESTKATTIRKRYNKIVSELQKSTLHP